MNLGLSEKLKAEFPEVVPVERPEVTTPSTIDPNWFAGFTSGEGSFMVNIYNSQTKLGQAVRLVFEIAQHERDEMLIRRIRGNLNCGNVYRNKEVFNLRVLKYSDINNKIIPFFKKYPVHGVKA